MREVLVRLVDFITTSDYAHAFLILFLFIIGSRIILYFFKHVLERLARKTPSRMDDKIVIKMETPIVIIMVLVGVQLAAKKILSEGLVVENFINTLIVVVITGLFIGIGDIIISYWARNKENESNEEFHHEVQPLVKSLSKILFIAIGLVAILQMWGVQVGTTLASVGILGVVLGFAFQDTMKNIFGGISLIVDDSIHKKDIIRLESGETGEVVEVNLRSTKIRTFDNEYLIVPNGVLSTTKIINLAEPTPTLRIDIPVSVAYGSDPEKVKQVLLGTLKGLDEILKFPKREVRFIKLNDFSIDFMLLFFISNFRQKFQMENVVITKVYAALRENNIEIPFPSRTTYEGKPIVWETNNNIDSKSSLNKLKKRTTKTTLKKQLKKQSKKIFKKTNNKSVRKSTKKASTRTIKRSTVKSTRKTIKRSIKKPNKKNTKKKSTLKKSSIKKR